MYFYFILQDDVLNEKETEEAHINGTFVMQEHSERINQSVTNTPV